VSRRFGYGPRLHRGNYFSCRPSFPVGGAHNHFEFRHLDGPHFSVVVHVSLGQIMKC
jgi:hypothetical protein